MSTRAGIGVELCGYHETDRADAPRQLRVDLVDRDALTTVVSLSTSEALALSGELLAAVIRARDEHDVGERAQ